MPDREKEYHNRLEGLKGQFDVLKKRRRKLGITRLISFAGAFLLFFIFLNINGLLASLLGGTFMIGFLVATVIDNKNNEKISFIKLLILINEEEVKALHNDLSPFEPGAEFKDPAHPYANDLDIFGPFSIYQFLNRTTTFLSARRLADWLKSPAKKEHILRRQKASKELSGEVEWRQNFQAVGRHKKIGKRDFEQIIHWSKEETEELKKWNMLTTLILTLTLLFILAASFQFITWNILWISLILHLWAMWRYGKVVAPHYAQLSKTIAALSALEKRLALIAQKPFEDPYLRKLQTEVNTSPNEEVASYEAIHSLKKIMKRLDIRLNPLVHFPLNFLTFWDWHQFRRLTHLHKKIKEPLPRWADVLVEMDTLCSLANSAYNHPEWGFPEIKEGAFKLVLQHAGHPLIPSSKRVCNDFTLLGKGKITLITGSNMAGKSTFLRTIGVNTVLAMAGAPVCADQMEITPVHVISSMRIADNLEENISTFYAELQKLEYIIQEANKGGNNLLLMDEILRGTNSNDRHTGSRALINQLIKVHAVGILATHDLALTNMEEQHPGQIENYHFDVQVKDEELYFDYSLKKGICKSMNASILMKKIGIEL